MRLRLVHQLALLLVAAVLLAVTTLGAVVAWNLRSGFGDYLRAQDAAWLERFAAVAAAEVERSGIGVLSGPREALGPLLQAAAPGGAARPPPARAPRRMGGMPPQRPGEAAEHPFPPEDPLGRGERPPGPGRPLGPPDMPGGPEGPDHVGRPEPPDRGGRGEDRGGDRGERPLLPDPFAPRLKIFAPDGRQLWGRPLRDNAPAMERKLVVGGQEVAILRLVERPATPGGVDSVFLLRQYRGIALTGGLLVLLALAIAAWVGRRWLRPVTDAQAAARRIARGEFDVRLQRQGSDELGDLVDDINAMAASLEQLEGSRRRWIAELSHELRTPLAVLRAEVEGLLDGVRPMQREAIVSLQGEVARLTRLTEDFHQLALSDLRSLPCHPAAADAGALVRECAARHAERAAQAGLSLSTRVDAGLPQVVWDADRIRQLLDNLVENSLRYTDAPGRVELSAVRAPDGGVVLAIDDSAPGVPAEALPRLFDPLYRVESSRNRKLGGSGLGLSICRAIVMSHDGRIEASPSAWGGLRVSCRLPRSAQPDTVAP